MKKILLTFLTIFSLNAMAANIPPVSVISATPTSGYAPLTVTLDGTGSYDPDGSIVSYNWTFGDGTTGTGAIVTHTYTQSTNRTVRLSVTDNSGSSRSTTQVLTLLPDTDNPSLDVDLEPNSVVRTSTPTFTAFYDDPTSQVNLSRVYFYLDADNVTGHAVISGGHAVLQFTSEWPLTPGNHTLAVRVHDYYNNYTLKTIQFKYEADLPPANYVSGTIVDENNAPISGVTLLSIDGPVGHQLSGTTDTNGNYALPFSQGGEYKVRISKAGYVEVQKVISIVTGQDYTMNKSYITSADTKSTLISATSGGIASNTQGNIIIDVPANSLASNASISFTDAPTGKILPVQLPNASEFTYAFNAQPSGTQFSDPASMSVDNTLGFPPGFEIPVGYTSTGMNVWSDSGFRAVVSPDGTKVNFQVAHFSDYDINSPSTRPSDPQGPPDGPADPGDSNDDGDPATGCEGQMNGSRINATSCNLSIDYRLPKLTRRGTDHAIQLSYSSLSANPKTILSVRTGKLDEIEAPTNLRRVFEWAGQVDEKDYAGETAVKPSALYAVYDPKNAAGANLSSGSIPYRAELGSRYDTRVYGTAPYFGGPVVPGSGSVPTREPVYLKESIYGRATIDNQRNSIFGAGWNLNGWERLHLDPDGVVTHIDGSGNSKYFTPLSFGVGSKKNQKRASGEDTSIIYHKGFFYGASCGSNEVFRLDLQGRYTTLFGKGKVTDLNCPKSIFPSRKGGFYIADSGNSRILYIDSNQVVKELANDKKGNINDPSFVTEDNVLAVHFIDGNEIKTISPHNGEVLNMISNAPDALIHYELKSPTQIIYDEYHNLIVVDKEVGSAIKFYMNSSTSRVILDSIEGLSQLSFDPILKRYFALNKEGSLYHWDGQGKKRTEILDSRKGLKLFRSSDSQKSALPKIFSMAYSPEVGLAYVGESGLQLETFDNYNKKMNTDIYYLPSLGEFSELVKKTDGTFERHLVDKTIVKYDSSGYITERLYTDGTKYTYSYDPTDHRLLRVYLPTNDYYELNYDNRGFVQSITDPANRTVELTINNLGDLVQITDPENEIQEFGYDTNHLLISKTDERSLETQYAYELSRLVGAIYPGNREREINNTIVSSLISQSKQSEIPRTDSNAVFSEFVSAEGRATTFVVDQYGAFHSKISGEGDKTNYVRNSSSLPTTVVSPEGVSVFRGFDNLGRPTYQLDAKGSTSNTYDSVTQKVSKQQFSNGTSEEYTYNLLGLPATIKNRRGIVTTYTYYSDGTLQSVKDALNNETTYERDGFGNITAIVQPSGARSEMAHDSAGNITSVKDPNGNVSSFDYDLKGRLVKETSPLNHETNLSYQPTGELLTLTDAKNNTTSFTYNDQNKVSKITNPLGHEENFTYDLDGNLTQKVTKLGQIIDYTYNNNNQLVSKEFGSETVTFAYTKDKKLASALNSDTECQRNYDFHGRIINESCSHYNGILEYTYSSTGSIASRKLILNDKVILALLFYQNASENDYYSTGSIAGNRITISRDFDLLDRVTAINYPNSMVSNFTYDKNSRPTSISTSVSGLSYSSVFTYDGAGNISSVAQVLNGQPRPYRYQYDAANRLTVEDSVTQNSFNYDPLGNNLSKGGVYNELNQLLEDNTYTYQYDLNGNLIKKTSKVGTKHIDYIWSAENQLRQVKLYDNIGVLSKDVSYKYDALGRRVERRVVSGTSDIVRKYVYDGEHIIAILDGSNNFVAGYAYGPGTDDPLVLVTDYNEDGKLDTLNLVKDHQNSVKLVMDGTKVLQEMTYSAYGETSIGNRGQDKISTNNVFYYTSRELEPETGDYFYRARYYDPKVGRFLSEDPIHFAGGDYNLYRYVENQPVVLRDPSGNNPLAFVIGGAIAGGGTGLVTGFFGSSSCTIGGRVGDALISAGIGALGGAIAGIGVATGGSFIGTGATLFGGMMAGAGVEAISQFGNFGGGGGGSSCTPPPPSCP